jgi:hypothetical protein
MVARKREGQGEVRGEREHEGGLQGVVHVEGR